MAIIAIRYTMRKWDMMYETNFFILLLIYYIIRYPHTEGVFNLAKILKKVVWRKKYIETHVLFIHKDR